MRSILSWPRFRSAGRVWLVPTHHIKAAAPPMRQAFDHPSLVALAESLSTYGMLSPLLITMEGETPLLVAGHRRLKAAKIAGMREVPCLLVSTDRLGESLLSLAENIRRTDLTPEEREVAAIRLGRQFGLSPQAIGDRLGGWPVTPKEEAAPRSKPRPPAPLVGDMRLFINSLNHTVDTMRQSGIGVEIAQTERDKCTELTIRIPKRRVG